MTTERRRFTPLNMLAGSPTLESLVRREPTRRHFRQLSDGGTSPTEPAVLDEWQRLLKLSSILSGDNTISGYTHDWVYRPYSTWNRPVYSANLPASPTTLGPIRSMDRWEISMRPVRIKICSYEGIVGIGNALYTDGTKFAFSEHSPPSAGHTKGAIIRSLSFRAPFFHYAMRNISLSALRYVRLVKNGTTIGNPVPVESLFYDINAAQTRTPTWTFDIPFTTTVTASDVIEVDCWLKIDFLRHNIGGSGSSTPSPDLFGCWIVPFGASLANNKETYNTLWTGINCKARIGQVDKFAVTWGSNSPGGTSPLTFEAQAGWMFQQVSLTSMLMTKTTGPLTGEKVFFDYGREIPYIVATRLSSGATGVRPIARYLPQDSGHYMPSLAGKTDGVWYPASTVFPIMGVATTTGNPVWSPVTGATTPSNMPSTCTLERV